MRRLTRLLAFLLLLPVVLAAALLLALNTAPGRTAAERLAATLTHDQIRLEGLEGRFPDHLRLRHLAVQDATGTWLEAHDIVLDWSPLALLHRQALIQNLTAARLQLPRLPATTAPATPSTPATLPIRVTIDHLGIARAEILTLPPLSGTAAADVLSLEEGAAEATLLPLSPGEGRGEGQARYTATAHLNKDAIAAKIDLQEPQNGPLARLANLPDLGPIHLTATTTGPKSALTTNATLTAGPLTAAARATIDLLRSTATVDLTAQAPAMTPAPGVAWRAIALDAHSAGPFTAPEATGHLRVDALQSAGATLDTVSATIAGNAGQASIRATFTKLRLPGPNPDLLAAAPIQLEATTRLDDPTRPVTFSLTHPLLAAQGQLHATDPPNATIVLTLPDLTPIGALAGLDLAGRSTFTLRTPTATTLDVDGTLNLTAAPPPALALLGPAATLGLSARLDGPSIDLTRLTLEGAAIHLATTGISRGATLDASTTLRLDDLAVIAPTLTGAAQLDARLHGPANALALDATATGDVGAGEYPPMPIRLTAALTNLPGAPTGRITAAGTFAGAPLALALHAARTETGALAATIDQADWRSLHAEGALDLAPGATIPTGQITLRMPRLEDLRPLLGQPIQGAVTATAQIAPAAITFTAEARNAGLPAAHAARTTLTAHVSNPQSTPTITATLTADGIATPSVTGSVRLEAAGTAAALILKTTAALDAQNIPAQLAATAALNTQTQRLTLQTFQLTTRTAKPETLRLLAPATIHYAPIVTVDHLRLGLRQAVLDVAGRLAPTLDTTITLRTPADIASLILPDQPIDGAIAVDAHLTGLPAQPAGAIRLTATALHARTGPAASLAPATLIATTQLAGPRAQIDARLTGPGQLTVIGQVPIGPGVLNLRTIGALDLALLNPHLGASGRRATGRLSLDAAITGPVAAPAIAGTAQLTGGDVQDFTQGVHLTALQGTIRADGQTIRLALDGRATPGTVALAGTAGLAPTHPLDLTLTLRNARPLASDTIAATVDADLTLRGPAASPTAAGRVLIRRAELQIPRTLPASVVTLDVHRPGQRAAPPPGAATTIPLDLTIDAPNQVFVRGRGVDAEMAGSLRIRGTSTAPQVAGALTLRRGNISLAGTTLDFSRGRVGFDGTGVSGRIDPTLDFAADSAAAGVTATLSITGYVSRPKIALTSVPALPQDEVLAYLLFKRSAKELGPFQLASIAAGLADLTGVGGGGLNPLDSVRRGLGLDRLSLGTPTNPANTTSTTTTPTIEAGRYVANGVYVGARQGATGGQTGATVQIDITKGLKLETDVGTGQGSNQVGITYQFEY